LLDAKRRDFSINAMYYFSVEQKTKKELDYSKDNPKILSELDLLKVLKTQ
jgi:tRNA nucleotidyltransferase/poly(A) polymerase